MRVLVVEDEPTMAGLLRRALVEEGYAVDVAGTGDAGYRYATTAAFDAIVLDVLLPGVSGFEVCARLRRGRVWTPVPGTCAWTRPPGGCRAGRPTSP